MFRGSASYWDVFFSPTSCIPVRHFSRLFRSLLVGTNFLELVRSSLYHRPIITHVICPIGDDEDERYHWTRVYGLRPPSLPSTVI